MTDHTSTGDDDPQNHPAAASAAEERLATADELDNDHRTSAWRRPRTILIVVAAAIAIGAAVAFLVASMQPTVLESAVESCELESNEYVSLGDDGQTLTIDGASEAGDDGAVFADTACVLATVDASTAALAQMDGTNSLQGRQTATWDDIDASWTYHPDDGFDLILTTGSN